jgi:hypothetical protein
MERAAGVVGQVADRHPRQHEQRDQLRRQDEQHRHERELRRHGVAHARVEAHAREHGVREHERDRRAGVERLARVAEDRQRDGGDERRHADRELGTVLVPRRRFGARRRQLPRRRRLVVGRDSGDG